LIVLFINSIFGKCALFSRIGDGKFNSLNCLKLNMSVVMMYGFPRVSTILIFCSEEYERLIL